MTLANVIMIGAQKSGTSSLCKFLSEHPQCVVSDPKEPNFYSRADNLAHPGRYERCFRAASGAEPARIDGTTTYLADPRIAGRIAGHLGRDIKLIAILRAPAARTYSGFLHMVKRGHERRSWEEVFESLPDDPDAALAAERLGIEKALAARQIKAGPYVRQYDDVLWNYRYLGNSLYSRLIQPYLAEFPRERLMVLIYEEMFARPDLLRVRLGDFLGVDPDGFREKPPLYNDTRLPDLDSPLGVAVEQARWIKRGNYTRVRPRVIKAAPSKAPSDLTARLKRIAAGETSFWSDYLGRDLTELGW